MLDALKQLEAPDAAAARGRAAAVVLDAFEQREPVRAPARRRRPWLAALAAVAGLTALSPAGEALGDWVSRTVHPKAETAKPALTALPARGSILALAGDDLWLVHRDGSRRHLGRYEDATFSPGALFVATTRGARLSAVDPRGNVRWSLDRAGGVSDPRWAPSGLRVAYRAGHGLRVVYGDGYLDRRLARRVAPVAPVWRPGPAHVLTWVDRSGRVVTADTDSRARLWETRPHHGATQLAWSPDGRELIVATNRGITRVGPTGRVIGRQSGAPTAVAWLPGGRRFITTSGSSVTLHDGPATTALFTGPGTIDGLAVSPDGRWAVVGWSGADQWLFLPTDRHRRPRTAAAISRDFSPDGSLPPFPRPLGWR